MKKKKKKKGKYQACVGCLLVGFSKLPASSDGIIIISFVN